MTTIATAQPPPRVTYCPPGRHRWAPPHDADHPRQCWDCPEVERREAQPRLLEAPRVWAEVAERGRR